MVSSRKNIIFSRCRTLSSINYLLGVLHSRGKDVYLQAHIAKFTPLPHVIVNELGNGYFSIKCQICTVFNKHKLINRTAAAVFLALLSQGCRATGMVLSTVCYSGIVTSASPLVI